jgi:ubiquinone/menaquinone biosynthesis C-methylase UbiE
MSLTLISQCCASVGVFIGAVYIYKIFFRQKVFAMFLNIMTKDMKSKFHPAKESLFNEAFENIKTNGERLKILEIGVGAGANFNYYPKHSEVTILDKSDIFLPYIKENLKNDRQDDVIVDDLVIGKAEDLSILESDKFDGVVATLVMCSVDSPRKMFDEVYRILKPGGVYVYLDHSLDTKNNMKGFIQKFVEPVWGFFFDNCKFVDVKGLILSNPKFKNYKIYELPPQTKNQIAKFIQPIYYGYIKKEVE